MVSIEHSELGTELDINISSKVVKGNIVEKPFFDPRKKITSA